MAKKKEKLSGTRCNGSGYIRTISDLEIKTGTHYPLITEKM